MTNVKVPQRPVLSIEEIEGMIQKAEQLPTEYFKLRAKALVSIFRTGKRVGEVARVRLEDTSEDSDWLYVTFSLEKKRRKQTVVATKKFMKTSKYAQNIIRYKQWLKNNIPNCTYLFPSGHCVFGQGYIIHGEAHLNVRQVLRIIKWLNPQAWCHLFRETRGAERVKRDESLYGVATLETAFRVQRELDLVRTETALRYVQRHESQKVELEDEAIS